MLHGMGVKHIVVPAMKGVLPMWEAKFGYSQFTWVLPAGLQRCMGRVPCVLTAVCCCDV